jgi:chromosome segregation ATPase
MGENVPGHRVLSVPDNAATALNLVHQAADVFRTIEEHAHEIEARAQSLSERLRLSETRAEHAERAQRELLISTEHKLQEASRALEHAQSRIEAQEDRLTAIEFRAQAAEAEAREAKQALALVEDAIRRRLLSLTPGADSRLTAVA